MTNAEIVEIPTRKPRNWPKRKISVKKPRGVSKLMKDLDLVFSRYVRMSRADQEGNVSCYTCNYKTHYKKMQNGHYISRFYKKYRFDERNCRVQCSMCNMWKNGDIPTFRQNLVKELGLEVVQQMESDFKELHRLEAGFLTEKIARYKALVEKEEKRLNGVL